MNKRSQTHTHPIQKDPLFSDPTTFSDRTTLQGARRLIDAVQEQEREPLTCAECRREMAEYWHLTQGDAAGNPVGEAPSGLPFWDDTVLESGQAQGPAPTDLIEAVAAHLATCAESAAVYALLQKTLMQIETDSLPDVAPPRPFDLSFIKLPATPSAASVEVAAEAQAAPLWVEPVSAGLWRLAQEVKIWLAAGKASFASLQEYLAPPGPALAHFRSNLAGNLGNSGKSEVLQLPAPDADFRVYLATSPVVGGSATVAVKLLALDDATPLYDRQLTLRNEERQLLVGCVTGEDGGALFERLTPGRYFLQIRHQQKIWEIPLEIIES